MRKVATASRMETKKTNTKARDIKRRLDVIKEKMEDLTKMGIPCVFCYVAPWSGGLMFTGDPRMMEILTLDAEKLMEALDSSAEQEQSSNTMIVICLPHLPGPLQDLNARTFRDRNHKGLKHWLEWRSSNLVATRYTILQATHNWIGQFCGSCPPPRSPTATYCQATNLPSSCIAVTKSWCTLHTYSVNWKLP